VEERFKPQIQPALPALLQCLKNKDHRVRSAAALALTQCDAAASSTVPALIAALEKETNNSVSGIFYALGSYKTNASPAVPLLLEIVKSQPYPLPLNPALNALRKIDPEAAKPFIEEWKASFQQRLTPKSVQP
jgi:HEAT repeat protein